ncbi:MAG: FAD-dependent oxidoreductase [Acidimicrobiales bacterium]|nr:FAD-dependent oxidoreductase [Acidimicrobiales bacterium]
MSQHRSVWLATSDAPAYPALAGDVTADVAVVGAGITGLTAALLIQRGGRRVVVVEAGRVGGGTTGHTTGKVTSQHSLIYRDLIERHGEARARLYAEANEQAIDVIARLAEETEADCRFERAPAYVYAETADQRGAVEAEHAAALRLGLPATLTTEFDLPVDIAVALRFDDQAHIHASRYTAALARAIVAGGGEVFEHSRAMGIEERRDEAVVHTEGGDIRAPQVVVATLLPFVDRGGFFARAQPGRSYGVAARLRGDAPAGMHISAGSPTRSTRPWVDGDRPGVIVVGESHPTGEGDQTPARWGELERWTREHLDVESFEYRWSSQDYVTVDGIPYVGRSPRMARTLVATGFRKWGLTNGTAAARMLADLVDGRDNPWLEAFDATRIGGAAAVKKLVEANVHVATRFVGDRIARLRPASVAHLEPGDGGVVDLDGHTVGAYRDPGGELHAVSVTCTHLGCTLRWNGAETSWDCPCHGSRFSYEGAVLDGPAVRPLERIDVDRGT